ncbi:MAG: hypothetical protein KUA38_06550 [Hydrogenophaga sp.]|nr:hypothetical protein [Hydrogenophaga sp.]
MGLGIMGTPMALNLSQAGHPLLVSRRSKIPAALEEQGGHDPSPACGKRLG